MDNSNISEKVTKEEERSKRKYPIRIDKKRYNRMGYSDKENVTFDKSFWFLSICILNIILIHNKYS